LNWKWKIKAIWPSHVFCVASVINGTYVLYKPCGAYINSSPFDATPPQEHRQGMRVNFVLTSDSHGAVPNQDDDDNMLPHAKLLPSLTYVCFVWGRIAGWMVTRCGSGRFDATVCRYHMCLSVALT
jgi:hypothetical protein